MGNSFATLGSAKCKNLCFKTMPHDNRLIKESSLLVIWYHEYELMEIHENYFLETFISYGKIFWWVMQWIFIYLNIFYSFFFKWCRTDQKWRRCHERPWQGAAGAGTGSQNSRSNSPQSSGWASPWSLKKNTHHVWNLV